MGFDGLFEPSKAAEAAAQAGDLAQVVLALARLRQLEAGILRGAEMQQAELAELAP